MGFLDKVSLSFAFDVNELPILFNRFNTKVVVLDLERLLRNG